MSFWLRTAALSPILLWQGLKARRQALILPEAPGDRMGHTGSGPPLRLLITGDSAAAGVGARDQQEALLGNMVELLSTRYSVSWRLEARSGATTRSTLQHLEKLPPAKIDVAAISLGVNDVTSGVALGRWPELQAELHDLLRSRFGVRQILVSGLPPMHLFPALPQPLRWHLGLRARQFDRALQTAVANSPDCVFVALPGSGEITDMAEDGFHPGPDIYRRWAYELARQVCEADT